MPKIKQLEKCKHPNSRKTVALIKQIKKQSNRDKMKLSGNMKLNLLGEKVAWFRDNLDPSWNVCSPEQVEELILKYLNRFNDELEQIRIKHSIGNRKNRQHASREDIIKLTVKREFEEYNSSGLEMPNLLDQIQFSLLKSWSGELRYLQNFKLRKFSKDNLQYEIKKVKKSAEAKTNSETQIKDSSMETESNS